MYSSLLIVLLQLEVLMVNLIVYNPVSVKAVLIIESFRLDKVSKGTNVLKSFSLSIISVSYSLSDS